MSLFQLNKEDYLDEQHLHHLRSYQYRSVDASIVGHYVLQPWWRLAAGWLPRWMAPNLVTLLGFSLIMFNVLCLAVFLPDLAGPASSWLYVSFAIGLFGYQTMDNLDGKQARATGTSSPLGELFDHVIDSLNCPLGGLVQAASMGLGHSGLTVFFIVIACWPMYLSTWEEFHTGVLFLGVVNGPDDGLLLAVVIMLVSAIFGPSIWHGPASDILPSALLAFLPKGTQLMSLFVVFVLFAVFVGHAPACFAHVASTVGHQRFPSTLVQLVPLLVFSASISLWLLSPHSAILEDQHLVEFTLALCFLFGRLSTRIILAHLTKGNFPMSILNLFPLAVGASLVTLPSIGLPALLTPQLELLYLHGLLVYSCARFAFSSHRIIDAFCRTLGIRTLSIT